MNHPKDRKTYETVAHVSITDPYMTADLIGYEDSELDLWMNDHPGNPANQETDPTNIKQQRSEDQYAFEAFEQWRSEDR